MSASDTSALETVDYRPEYQDDFARLNYEWLEKYFAIEPADRPVLEDPEGYILANGGSILFARLDGKTVGTCALIKVDDSTLELAKMGVTEACQGKHIGKRLLEAAIERARQLGATKIILETSSRLAPARHLYDTFGFVETPEILTATYERADVAMTLDLTK